MDNFRSRQLIESGRALRNISITAPLNHETRFALNNDLGSQRHRFGKGNAYRVSLGAVMSSRPQPIRGV